MTDMTEIGETESAEEAFELSAELRVRVEEIYGRMEKDLERFGGKIPDIEDRADVITFNSLLLINFENDIGASSIAYTAITMKHAAASGIPIATLWSGKDWISLVNNVRAARFAGVEDPKVFAVDTPFITEETREVYRKAEKMGVKIFRAAAVPKEEELTTLFPDWRSGEGEDYLEVQKRVGGYSVTEIEERVAKGMVVEDDLANLGKTLTCSDLDAVYGDDVDTGWRNPNTGDYKEIMSRAKGEPTDLVTRYLRNGENEKTIMMLSGARIISNHEVDTKPILDANTVVKEFVLYPILYISEDSKKKQNQNLETDFGLKKPDHFTDPSRGRMLCLDDGMPILEDGAPVIEVAYPDGVKVKATKTSCPMQRRFGGDKPIRIRDVVPAIELHRLIPKREKVDDYANEDMLQFA